MCGCCLSIQARSKGCRHSDDRVTKFPKPEEGEPESVIVGIPRPSPTRPAMPTLPGAIVAVSSHHSSPWSLDEVLLDHIFHTPFRTVKSIPRPCRLAFSCALKGVLYGITSDPTSIAAWVRLLLLPYCTLQVFVPQNRQERRSGSRKYCQQKQILHALTVWNEPGGIFRLLERVTVPQLELPPQQSSSQNIRRCLQKVADGHFSAAVKVLASSGVAPNTPETQQTLEEKHLMRPPPSLPDIRLDEPPLSVERDVVLACIRSFPKGTACGRDGLRAQHLLDAMSGAASAIAMDLMEALAPVVNLWLQGRCPRVLAEFIASAPLTPLLKPGNGIRPIAVGMVWRRLVSKIAMKGVAKDMVSYLKDFQFGVGVPGGAEAILHAVNRFVHANKGDTSLSMLLVDFQNAFNLVDRTAMLKEVRIHCPSIAPWIEYLYCQSARLYLGSTHIWSAAGIQQGDPLGPLLFALVLHPLIHRIQSECHLRLQAWYLDDGTLIGRSEHVAAAIRIIQEIGPSLGLVLNVSKTELFWPSADPRGSCPDIFPAGISCPQLGVKLLGGAVSMDASFIAGNVHQRVDKTLRLMNLLPQLKDPQCELALLRSCMGLSKLMFALRTCPPDNVQEAAKLFDHRLRAALQNIVVSDGPGFGDLQWRVATLPLRLGGLGIYCATDVMKFAFVASRTQTKDLQDHILRGCETASMGTTFDSAIAALHISMPDFDLSNLASNATVPFRPQHVLAEAYYSKVSFDLEKDFELSAREKAVIECLRSEHAKDFLLAIPMEGLGQRMSPVEYRAILRYRLMIPLYSDGELCPVCKTNKLDAFGDHAVHCRHFPGFKYRHDHVRDILYDIFWRAGIHVKKEAPVNFLTDPREGRSTLRPADILVYTWSEGMHACVDITGASPMVGFGNGDFEVGRAARSAAIAKEEKHSSACKANQHSFIPFAFDTFGFLASEAVELLRRVQKVMDNNVMTVGSNEYVFRRIGFAIQKGLAAQFVARLSSTFV